MRGGPLGRWAGLIVAGCALVLASAPAAAPAAAPPLTLIGSLHEHSGYSDGWPGSRPADYYASGKGFGLDFVGSSDHSDNMLLPATLSEECLGAALPQCLLADPVNPADSFRKWDATLEQARAATDERFTAFRGFEWSSDRHGHINVFMSRNHTNARIDGGEVSVGTFWRWFERSPELGGGSDGIATFNHPGAKKVSETDPAFNWNDFAYRPGADGRMVGIEVFNDADDFGEKWYPHALDRGWHVGAIGAEDLGHRRSDDWGGPGWAKTVVTAGDRSENGIRAALLDRRFYAVRTPAVRLSFSVDRQPMGERLRRRPGTRMPVLATVSDRAATLELVTSGGKVVATGRGGRLLTTRRASADERWYFVRAVKDGKRIAYGSPVWIEPVQTAAADGTWLAGDLHVHTCFSHDAYCGPADDNTGPEEFYTLGSTVTGRFLEASLRGLDYLAITDHNDVRSSSDPGFGSSGVVGVPGYENSLRGHAQMIGARKVYNAGSKDAAAVNAMARALRADGGVLQLNHPHNGTPWDGSCDGPDLDWGYGTAVVPGVVEVWNSADFQLRDSTGYWEKCWLDRGHRIGATGGSDSHWSWLSLIQGVGNPTTWVLADGRSTKAVQAGVREGRTTISRLSPSSGGAPLLLEADADGDGSYEATIGDRVPPGTKMRVRSGGGPLTGTVRVRAAGKTIVKDEPLQPGGAVTFRAPNVHERGWVRAELWAPGTVVLPDGLCEGVDVEPRVCVNDFGIVALTSPIYLRVGDRPEPPGEDPSTPADEHDHGSHSPQAQGESGGEGAPTPAPTPAQPSQGRLRLAVRATIRARARKAISVPVSTNAGATVTIEVREGRKRVRSKRVTLRAGRKVVKLRGLAKGRYQVSVTARDASGRTAARAARLTVR